MMKKEGLRYHTMTNFIKQLFCNHEWKEIGIYGANRKGLYIKTKWVCIKCKKVRRVKMY